MRWDREKSIDQDVIDQRGSRVPGGAVGKAGGGLGLLGVVVVVLIQVLGGGGDGGGGGFSIPSGFGDATAAPRAAPIDPAQDPERDLRDFSAYVFKDTQDTWATTFEREGKRYDRAKLVLYRSGVNTGCGSATSAVGPFYCSADKRVYLDLSFYSEMARTLGAPGDFAWAYVIAHEIGHHVQDELGTSGRVRAAQRDNPGDANALSVRQELQADCYAGVWASAAYKRGELEECDIDEAFTAAEAVGDDRLQRQATGSVRPDTFTHGTSAQRRRWFDAGRRNGDAADCDTFSTESL